MGTPQTLPASFPEDGAAQDPGDDETNDGEEPQQRIQ